MLIVIGPSASGKTQIVNELIANYNLNKMVTYTTRPMRVNEIDGKDYHFISKSEFEEKIKNDFFLEYVEYNQNYYGTAKNDITSDKVVILEKEGLKAYIKNARDKIKIVYVRCSKPIRRIRMKLRQDLEENINKRLISDDLVFGEDVEALADYVLDNSNTNVYDGALAVYKFYKPYL